MLGRNKEETITLEQHKKEIANVIYAERTSAINKCLKILEDAGRETPTAEQSLAATIFAGMVVNNPNVDIKEAIGLARLIIAKTNE